MNNNSFSSDTDETAIFANENLPQIEDIVLGQTIGQGSFGCVKSATLKANFNTVVAVKYIHLPTCNKHGLSEKKVTKEVALHAKCSEHPNILRLFDCNITHDYLWIILEMADGGDLFDKIEPDVGVDNEVAQFYFQQLVNALDYLHNKCHIAHRDIKPENILLDMNGNLKLADFGLASSFKKSNGIFRYSKDQRGSPPYMAPEILHNTKYLANITDIWSVGIFVFVLLTGEIPWEIAVKEDLNFKRFIDNNYKLSSGPWSKINLTHLNLLRKILQPDPKFRISLDDLKLHPWYNQKNILANSKGLCKNPIGLAKRLISNLRISIKGLDNLDSLMTQDPIFTQLPNEKNQNIILTQPSSNDVADIISDDFEFDNIKFHNTQTACTQIETRKFDKLSHSKWMDMISKDIAILQFTNSTDNESTQKENIDDSSWRFNPIKLTKFYSIEPMDILLQLLEDSLHDVGIKVKPGLYRNFIKITSKHDSINSCFPLLINIKALDKRGGTLKGFISITLIKTDLKDVRFERKSGDPLDWRRLFRGIALRCKDIILIPE